MAVSYAAKVYTNDKLFFVKLLLRWTGSVWQLLWVDFIFYLLMYVSLALVYRVAFHNFSINKDHFELVAKWISLVRGAVPLSFMLGFFVSSIVSRWWSMIMAIPWLHGPSFMIQSLLQGGEYHGDLARKMRLTLLRYMNIAWILCLADFSMQVKNRFNFKKKSTSWKGKSSRDYALTWRQRLDLINKDEKVKKYYGKLITDMEIETFAKAAELSSDNDYTYRLEYWVPLMWVSRLLYKAKQIGCIQDERHLLHLTKMVNDFRGGLGTMWLYSEFNLPLVYTQVATMGVYIYLLSGLFSSQLLDSALWVKQDTVNGTSVNWLQNDVSSPLLYIPILSAFEFIFYLGWYKIGMCLMNPLGEDDEDLPLSDFLNYNLKISVKCGAAEDSLFPPVLPENGQPEKQIIEVLGSFDFTQVRAHDKFESPEETEARLKAELKNQRLNKRVFGTGSELFLAPENTNIKNNKTTTRIIKTTDNAEDVGAKWNIVKTVFSKIRKESRNETNSNLPSPRRRRASSLNDIAKITNITIENHHVAKTNVNKKSLKDTETKKNEEIQIENNQKHVYKLQKYGSLDDTKCQNDTTNEEQDQLPTVQIRRGANQYVYGQQQRHSGGNKFKFSRFFKTNRPTSQLNLDKLNEVEMETHFSIASPRRVSSLNDLTRLENDSNKTSSVVSNVTSLSSLTMEDDYIVLPAITLSLEELTKEK